MVLLSRTCGTDTALNRLGVPLLAQVMSPEDDMQVPSKGMANQR